MLETDTWDKLMAVNSRGVFLGTKYAVLAMKRSGGGSIVNLSSIAGVTGSNRTHMGYNASKGAVRTLTKSTAVQFGGDGIRVNSVHPGLMQPMRTSGLTADPAVRAKVLEGVPWDVPVKSMRWRMPRNRFWDHRAEMAFLTGVSSCVTLFG